ncbi:MAG: DUF6677 family protein [Phycisphaeraceae bacterium]
MIAKHDEDRPRWNVLAGIAGWLIPGGGHAVLGERDRALVLLLSIGGLWVSGALLGGISVFDRAEHPAWYACQVLVAPTVLVERFHASLKDPDGKAPAPPSPAPPPASPSATGGGGQTGMTPAYEPSHNRVNEQGTIFTAMAGLLNLLAIMDVMYRDPRRHQEAAEGSTEGTPAHA